jgi:hypothetical protein
MRVVILASANSGCDVWPMIRRDLKTVPAMTPAPIFSAMRCNPSGVRFEPSVCPMPKREVEQGNFFTNLFFSKSEMVWLAMLTMRTNWVGVTLFFSQAEKKLQKYVDNAMGGFRLLCGKSYKFINHLKNNIARLLVLPIFWFQTSEPAGQRIEFTIIRENVAHSLDIGIEVWKPSAICRIMDVYVKSGDGGLLGQVNLRSPSLQESKELAPAGRTITHTGKPVTNQSTDKDADNSENRICQWATHIVWF